MATTVSYPSTSQDEPVGAGNAQDRRPGRESTTLPHPVDSPEQTLNDAEQLPKGETEGSKGKVDSKAERNKDKAELEKMVVEFLPNIVESYVEYFRLLSLGDEISPSDADIRKAFGACLSFFEISLFPRICRRLNEDE